MSLHWFFSITKRKKSTPQSSRDRKFSMMRWLTECEENTNSTVASGESDKRDTFIALTTLFITDEDDGRCTVESAEEDERYHILHAYEVSRSAVKSASLWDGQSAEITLMQFRNMFIFLFKQMKNSVRQRFRTMYPHGVADSCLGMSGVSCIAAAMQFVDMSLTDDDIHSFALTLLPNTRVSLQNCPPTRRYAYHCFMAFKTTVPHFASQIDEFRAAVSEHFYNEDFVPPPEFRLPLHALLNCMTLLFESPFFKDFTAEFYNTVLDIEKQLYGACTSNCTIAIDYEVLKEIGYGTFGVVFHCVNRATGKPLALKRVPVNDSTGSMETSVRTEVNMLKLLHHKNIVSYYGYRFDPEEQVIEILMEYAMTTIRKVADELGGLNVEMISHYAEQILEGLCFLHSQHVIHRDIKGRNVLLTHNGEVKLSDFGTAFHQTSASSSNSLQWKSSYEGQIQGTPAFLAPEIIFGCVPTEASDIWSLGCTMVELAAAKDPWSETVKDVDEIEPLLFHIGTSNEVPKLPSDCPAASSELFLSFVGTCLQRDPCKRPTAAELLQHPFLREFDEWHVQRSATDMILGMPPLESGDSSPLGPRTQSMTTGRTI